MKSIKNEKGMTIVELITSFSLSLIVMIFLFNIVLLLKDTYNYNSTKSSLVLEQSLLSSELNRDFSNEKIKEIERCSAGDFCYDITIKTSTGEKQKRLSIDKDDKTIKYGNSYNYTLGETEKFGDLKIYKNQTDASGNMNSYLVIEIPILSKISDEVFGVKIIYTYYDGAPGLELDDI